jgi:hypothetical protein
MFNPRHIMFGGMFKQSCGKGLPGICSEAKTAEEGSLMASVGVRWGQKAIRKLGLEDYSYSQVG